MVKRLVRHQFDLWLEAAYDQPDGAWRRRLGRWYSPQRQGFWSNYLRRQIKRAIERRAVGAPLDLGWQPLGFEDLEIRSSSNNLLTAPLYLAPASQIVFEFYRRFAKPGSVAVDVGTNNGAHALVLGRCVGVAGRVYGFEPSPSVYAQALENRDHNTAAHVEIACLAVADQAGEARFDDASGQPNTGISRISDAGRQTVRLVALDDHLPEGLDVSLIKIDVEGHELKVLKGAKQLLLRCCPAVILEFNLHTYSWDELLNVFPYPVDVFLVPRRQGTPLVRLESARDARKINERHIDVVVLGRERLAGHDSRGFQ